ncbi:MAG: hypothetical protein II680_12495 [Clostridia bacterium]|nr:hypothetical protein [Clostridia bacterium]
MRAPKRTIRFLTAVFLCFCICFPLTSCAGKTPGLPYSDPEADVWSPDPEDAAVSDTDGTRFVRIPDGARTADLTSLCADPFSGRLHVDAPVSLKNLILPAGTVSASVEPAADGTVCLDLLDASAAEGLTRLVLYGEVKAARIPDSLHTLVFFGGDLSGFAECPSLTELSILHPTDLSPLRTDPPLGLLALFRSPEDGEWDLSPLAGKSVGILRLMAGVTSKEAASMAGAAVEALQISDSSADDLSFLASMPDTKILMLGISSDQPREFYEKPDGPLGEDLLPLLNTPIPAGQLLDFAERGEIYAFSEINR